MYTPALECLGHRMTTTLRSSLRELGESDYVAAWIAHIKFGAAVKCFMSRLEHWRAQSGPLRRVDVADRDEQRRRSPGQFRGCCRVVGEHARLRLIHHLDSIALGARKDQLTVWAGYMIVRDETKALYPECDVRLHGVHDEYRGDMVQFRRDPHALTGRRPGVISCTDHGNSLRKGIRGLTEHGDCHDDAGAGWDS